MRRFIPSWAAMIAALTAALGVLLAWARRDAKHDVLQTLEKKDETNAAEIRKRVADARRDQADRLAPPIEPGPGVGRDTPLKGPHTSSPPKPRADPDSVHRPHRNAGFRD